jgi:hypothetical protein
MVALLEIECVTAREFGAKRGICRFLRLFCSEWSGVCRDQEENKSDLWRQKLRRRPQEWAVLSSSPRDWRSFNYTLARSSGRPHNKYITSQNPTGFEDIFVAGFDRFSLFRRGDRLPYFTPRRPTNPYLSSDPCRSGLLPNFRRPAAMKKAIAIDSKKQAPKSDRRNIFTITPEEMKIIRGGIGKVPE